MPGNTHKIIIFPFLLEKKNEWFHTEKLDERMKSINANRALMIQFSLTLRKKVR